MLPHLNPPCSFKRSSLHPPTLIANNLHAKYVIPQLYNYCLSHFFMFLEAKSKQGRVKHKQYIYARDCCEYLHGYYDWEQITERIRPTILKNTKDDMYFYFDVDLKSGQILMSHVEDRYRVKMQKNLAKNYLAMAEATTAEKLSIRHKKKLKMDQLCKEASKSENSMKSILDLRECIDVMTQKFKYQNTLVNYYIDNSKKKHSHKKENPETLKKAIEKEKISIILKKERSKCHGPERELNKNLDNYGLKNLKQGKVSQIKHSNKSHSLKKHLCNLKYKSDFHQAEQKQKETKEHKVAKHPLTPAPRYYCPSNHSRHDGLKGQQKKKTLSKQRVQNKFKQKKDHNQRCKKSLLGENKFCRSKIKSLSPKN